jgi:transposase
MSYEAALPATSFRGRRTKLTPERIEQIKELIKSGVSCEEIASLVGVTTGTLKVSCSRLGISLRRPRPKNGNCWPLSKASVFTRMSIALWCEVRCHRALPRRRARD